MKIAAVATVLFALVALPTVVSAAGSLPLRAGDSPDVLALDPRLRRLYVSSESGVVGVFRQTANALRPLGLTFLAPTAHTVAVDPRTHRVYFPLERGTTGRPQLLIMRPT